MERDLIAALATAPGEGGVAIVRMSGPGAKEALGSCFARKKPGPWSANRLYYGHVLGARGEHIDEAMAVFMRAPRTYTREDVAEIHCHGGRSAPERVLRRLIELGARPAKPGEFTMRAFLNGRIDLSEAEGVMALVAAGGERAARAALRQMEGGVSREVRRSADDLLEVLSLIEAGDDFPEEIEEKAAAGRVLSALGGIRRSLEGASDPDRARIVREGFSVALVGRPNTGKSSLLNRLVGGERAIVTAAPGTTRDVLSERLELDGVRMTLLDTAGQRETGDEAEKMGVDRAREAERASDLVLLVMDGSAPLEEMDARLLERADARYVAVFNKADLPERAVLPEKCALPVVRVSARTGDGVQGLLARLRAGASGAGEDEQGLVLERHLDLARRAIEEIGRAEESIRAGMPLDLVAVDVQGALEQLLTITGERACEQVIEHIFASFCVGK